MNKQRLLILAEYLETVPEENFDLSYWSCGTTACAIGHACNIPEFKEAGLKLSLSEQSNRYSAPFLNPILGELKSWRAVEHFFGLEYEQCGYLFQVYSYDDADRTPSYVSRRIRELCEEK